MPAQGRHDVNWWLSYNDPSSAMPTAMHGTRLPDPTYPDLKGKARAQVRFPEPSEPSGGESTA